MLLGRHFRTLGRQHRRPRLQRFRFLDAVEDAQERGVIHQSRDQGGVTGLEDLLLDLQGALEQGLGGL